MDGSALSVRDGRLHVEELACTELAARFGTPLYVMSETRLRSNVRRLGAALAAGWPLGEARLVPSIKANPTLATRAVLTSEGVGCDTFGETELEAALRAGVPPALISVNGASKSTALIRRAVAAGARITLDSGRELPIAEKAAAEALWDRGLAREGMLLEAEPGRAVYADAGLHLATVTNVKKQRDPDLRCWVETDTSEVFMLDTTLENALFPVVSATRADAEPTVLADVTGISCNFDVVAPAVAVPDLAPGEVIAFLETGAYQEASAANFNGLPRPATVLVCGTTAEVVKRRETIEDVLGRDIVPERLRSAAGAT